MVWMIPRANPAVALAGLSCIGNSALLDHAYPLMKLMRIPPYLPRHHGQGPCVAFNSKAEMVTPAESGYSIKSIEV